MTAPPVQLTREVRFQLPTHSILPDERIRNSWAGWPKTETLAPFVTVRITVAGPVLDSGFIADVKTLDRLVRDSCLSALIQAEEGGGSNRAVALFGLVAGAVPDGTSLTGLELCTTPFQSFAVDAEEPTMAILTHQFEFSAAHRLHCDDLSDEENRELFGKCNNPNGHGHNYVVQVSVDRDPAANFSLIEFEQTVCQHAIEPFDHKHLNVDVPDFASLNPTVENIAGVVWNRLEPHVDGLRGVRIYETAKTWAEVGR